MATDSQIQSWMMLGKKLGVKQLGVFKAIRDQRNGATLFELVKIMQLPINNISGRVSELCRHGYVRDSGIRRINPDSGKAATVWEVTDKYKLVVGDNNAICNDSDI